MYQSFKEQSSRFHGICVYHTIEWHNSTCPSLVWCFCGRLGWQRARSVNRIFHHLCLQLQGSFERDWERNQTYSWSKDLNLYLYMSCKDWYIYIYVIYISKKYRTNSWSSKHLISKPERSTTAGPFSWPLHVSLRRILQWWLWQRFGYRKSRTWNVDVVEEAGNMWAMLKNM